MEVRDGEPNISQQEGPLRRLMKNKQLRPFLQLAKDEGLLRGLCERKFWLCLPFGLVDRLVLCLQAQGSGLSNTKTSSPDMLLSTRLQSTVPLPVVKESIFGLRANVLEIYLQVEVISGILLWGPTLVDVPFFSAGM